MEIRVHVKSILRGYGSAIVLLEFVVSVLVASLSVLYVLVEMLPANLLSYNARKFHKNITKTSYSSKSCLYFVYLFILQ